MRVILQVRHYNFHANNRHKTRNLIFIVIMLYRKSMYMALCDIGKC